MGLREILEGIEKKVEKEIEEIKEEIEERKNKILDEGRKSAKQHKEEMIQKAKKEIDDEIRRALIQVRREEKKKTLSLKRKIMDGIFQEAKEKLLDMNKEEYLSLMKDVLLKNIKEGDEEILISPQDEKFDEDFIQEIKRSFLKKEEKKGELKLKFFPELDDAERGCIIRKKRMQINCTLSSLFSILKDKIEIEVARYLFG